MIDIIETDLDNYRNTNLSIELIKEMDVSGAEIVRYNFDYIDASGIKKDIIKWIYPHNYKVLQTEHGVLVYEEIYDDRLYNEEGEIDLEYKDSDFLVWSIAVEEEYQNKGIGSELLMHLKKMCQKKIILDTYTESLIHLSKKLNIPLFKERN